MIFIWLKRNYRADLNKLIQSSPHNNIKLYSMISGIPTNYDNPALIVGAAIVIIAVVMAIAF